MNQKTIQKLNQKILDHYLELDNTGNFKHPPSTDDELHEFVKLAFGFIIPRHTVTEGHRSPFDFLADLFFERVKNALAFATRAGGKTLDTAILNFLDLLFKPGCEIASAGAVKDQANKCYRYFRGFLDSPWFKRLNIRYQAIKGVPMCDPDKDSQQSKTVFANGSRLEVITGSEKGLRGPHPHKARVDEIDEIEWDVLQIGLSMARSGQGTNGNSIRGQNVFTSTRQHTAGTMQKLLDEAKEKGIEVYEWDVWEMVEKCTRRCKNDVKHGDCPIYGRCCGKAHHGQGFYLIDDFIDKVRLIDKTGFETEWENKKPSRGKLVYHMLDNKHIMDETRLFRMTHCRVPEPTWMRVGGLDFGSSPGHPFVFLKFFMIPNMNVWLLFHEYVSEQRLIRDHAKAIQSSPYYYSNEIIYADWDAQDRLELRDQGIRTRPAIKGPKSVNMGIDYICSLLQGYILGDNERPLLYIWYDCKYTLMEWNRYAWPIKPDGSVDRSGNPEKKNDHCSDAARMALYSHKHGGGAKYTARNLSGL